jgi:HAD superfamily hydrolase (TIGR01459 family)
MRHLTGLAEIASAYDGFIIDLWGVIHDGVAAFPGALDCLARLSGRPVLLLSNAPRRADPARTALRALGVRDGLYTAILTSGEATWQALRDRQDPWFAALGHRAYHLGPERDRSVIEDLSIDLVQSPAQASFILNTGPDDLRDGQSLEPFRAELDAGLLAGLSMVCANPDLEIVRGGQRILCAGALAAYYAERGGDVRLIGKPDPSIYNQAVGMLGVPRQRLLAVGDSLRTDIAGAAASGIDACWVLGGIHQTALGGDLIRIASAAQDAGLAPTAFIAELVW